MMKMTLFTIWLRGGGGKKSGGAHKFSLPFQNTLSPNWRENWSEKWKKYLYKTTLPLLTFFCFLLCNAIFCFLFFFLFIFSFFGFFFFSFLFFFLNFYFYYFFKEKTFGWFLMLFFEMSNFIYTQEIWW